jgi:hypothetical protein
MMEDLYDLSEISQLPPHKQARVRKLLAELSRLLFASRSNAQPSDADT